MDGDNSYFCDKCGKKVGNVANEDRSMVLSRVGIVSEPSVHVLLGLDDSFFLFLSLKLATALPFPRPSIGHKGTRSAFAYDFS